MPEKQTGYNPQKEKIWNFIGWLVLSIAMTALFVVAVIQFSLPSIGIIIGGFVLGVFIATIMPK